MKLRMKTDNKWNMLVSEDEYNNEKIQMYIYTWFELSIYDCLVWQEISWNSERNSDLNLFRDNLNL